MTNQTCPNCAFNEIYVYPSLPTWCPECGTIVDSSEHFRVPRRIKAATELLRALQRLVNDSMYKDHPEASAMAYAAIAEATDE